MKFLSYIKEEQSKKPADMAEAVKVIEALIRFADHNSSINLNGNLKEAVGLARDFMSRYKK